MATNPTCSSAGPAFSLDREFLGLLVCPVSHAPVREVGQWLYSTDRETRRRYPVRNGIPIMLIDGSEVVDEAEFDRVMAVARACRQGDSEATCPENMG